MQKIRTFSPDEKLVEERRGQIISNAVSLFAKKGFKSTGIREISRACNMTIGNLYHYIGKKEDIMSMALENGHITNLDFAEKTNHQLDSMNAHRCAHRSHIRLFPHGGCHQGLH